MFQEFEVKTNPATGAARVEALRQVMREKHVTAFLIPHADEHQNEYLPLRSERLAWLTGFTGSAGFCIVTLDKAVVFTDGRYTLQLQNQVDTTIFSAESLIEMPPSKWLAENMGQTDTIAYDPWLVTINQLAQYEKAAEKSGAKFQPTENLVDLIWEDQPPAPQGKVKLHDVKHAGKSAEEKLNDLETLIKEKAADACLLTDPASLAWAFNIRGNDMVHNPLALGFCLLELGSKPKLFMSKNKLLDETKAELDKIAELNEPETLISTLKTSVKGKSVLCDPNLVASILAKTIEENDGTIIKSRDPVVLPRAIKNQTEIEGARSAHLRDGVAMAKFLCWLDHQNPETLDEIAVAQTLESIRASNAKAMNSELLEISFDTISGFGSNGAIVHYRVNTDSNAKFANNNLYLCDSGAQYVDGTTDITRTVAIGKPPSEAVTDFTLVLKGHIALGMARFPKGTRGVDLDVLARNALWMHGKDYAHGTGHGIGSYMNVHEGPQNISKRGMEPLKPGMIVSNEPGYYVEGEYGIRIENLVLIEEAEDKGGNIETHGFENLTLAPIDLRLVDADLLNTTERDWLNEYHSEVREKLSPHLTSDEVEWLEKATAEI